MLQAEKLMPTPFLRDIWAGMAPVEKFDKRNPKRNFCSNC